MTKRKQSFKNRLNFVPFMLDFAVLVENVEEVAKSERVNKQIMKSKM